MIRKVVIIGPESTGKSFLCARLAAHYNTDWVREFAREFLLKHGNHYTYNDLLTIAQGQSALESIIEADCTQPVLFYDTNMYVMQVWSEYVFKNCDLFILDQIVEKNYDLYLLCKPDIPWEQDPLREYPDIAAREELYMFYKELMVNQNVLWTEISGDFSERFRQASGAIDQLLRQT